MSKFVWTQSALKDLEKDTTCPFRWKSQWIDRTFKSVASEAADYGNYFEYLVISANAKGEVVSDLPRNPNGSKTATQKRIEAQAEIAKEMLFDKLSKRYLGYTITSTQEKLTGVSGGYVPAEGTADIMAIEDSTGEPVIIDLKLTEDLDNVRTQYGWGNPTTELDLLQQVLYQQLYAQMTGKLPKMVLLVFEHGVKQRIKIINLKISVGKVVETSERFLAGADTLEVYNEKGWTYFPSEKECKNCPLTCSKRFSVEKIIVENVTY